MCNIDELEAGIYRTQDYVCSITTGEFELFCLERIRDVAEKEQVKNFSIDHNVKHKADDGTYQIDVFASFVAMGTTIKVLCECKQYKNKVKRETVQILRDKIVNLGMHKGILLSTSGFQSGAIDYAKKYGIALIQVYDQSNEAYSQSGGPNVVEDDKDPLVYCRKHWPKYRAIYFKPDMPEPIVIYPTRKIVDDIYHEMSRLTKEMYGFELPAIEEINIDEKNCPNTSTTE